MKNVVLNFHLVLTSKCRKDLFLADYHNYFSCEQADIFDAKITFINFLRNYQDYFNKNYSHEFDVVIRNFGFDVKKFDHIHILFSYTGTLFNFNLYEIVKFIKRDFISFMKDRECFVHFMKSEYVESIGNSNLDTLSNYIINQAERELHENS